MSTITKKLECIGDDTAQLMRQFGAFEDMFFGGQRRSYTGGFNRAWVAIIKDYYQGKFLREFPLGYKDYSEANSKGSRGVYKYYYLEEGYIYEVSEPTSWKNTDRYFCRVEDGIEFKMSKEEVIDYFEALRKLPQEFVDQKTGEVMTEKEYWEWLRKGI